MGLILALLRWWFGAIQRRHFRHVVFVTIMADVPSELPRDAIYVVGPPLRPKWAVFDCPCVDRHRLALDLTQIHYPSWRLAMRRGRPTIWPSVDVRAGKRCHYFVRDGRVLNVGDASDHRPALGPPVENARAGL